MNRSVGSFRNAIKMKGEIETEREKTVRLVMHKRAFVFYSWLFGNFWKWLPAHYKWFWFVWCSQLKIKRPPTQIVCHCAPLCRFPHWAHMLKTAIALFLISIVETIKTFTLKCIVQFHSMQWLMDRRCSCASHFLHYPKRVDGNRNERETKRKRET